MYNVTLMSEHAAACNKKPDLPKQMRVTMLAWRISQNKFSSFRRNSLVKKPNEYAQQRPPPLGSACVFPLGPKSDRCLHRPFSF